ncbi:acyl-CoA N-acyltransferase [Talaromyces proteolyticus]|uniref:Acyl-CoA N-acyltransferase n=1 Tax=Talaromyces proteolyticus TaxID=1131652 RepID=A0AAD4Q2G9_9EURO|nr:acyl-CoA N-acyltransferase [Talaromyces proteolyticus]KAH8700371.1 acyl-CoA N-acyltransferase [Talaromyces proteolyticus]
MTLALSLAEEADADRIADIHMAAFGTNLMLRAQFPTPSVRDKLRVSLAEKVINEIRDPKWEILIVRDEKEIVSFAKWRRPILESEVYVESPWNWPDGTRLDVLEDWTRIVEDASEKVLCGKPCYCLSFIGTDPKHERRGAASILIQWGLEYSKRDNIPVALESTQVAWPLYQKLGFRAEKDISMVLEGLGADGKPIIYEEKSLIFRPSVE